MFALYHDMHMHLCIVHPFWLTRRLPLPSHAPPESCVASCPLQGAINVPMPPGGRGAPRLTDVYIYGDDGRPYRGSLNVEITRGDTGSGRPVTSAEARRGGRQRQLPTATGARIVSPATAPQQPNGTMRFADHATIDQAGLQVAVPTVISASAPNNPLGRRVINPITPYELWGLKHPSLTKGNKRTNALEPLAAARQAAAVAAAAPLTSGSSSSY